MELQVPPTYRIVAEPARATDWHELSEGGSVIGAIVNVRNAHWCAIVNHSDFVFYVDSQQFPPVIIVEEDWCRILQKNPMTFLVRAAGSETAVERAELVRMHDGQ